MSFPRQEAPPLEGDLEFQVLDWYVPEVDKVARKLKIFPEERLTYDIYMFGCTDAGHSVMVKVTDFRPYFYVKAPNSWACNFAYNLNRLRGELLQERGVIPEYLKDHFVSIKQVNRKDFWGFTNNQEFPFIRVCCKSMALFNILKRFFQQRAKKGFQLYESNIDPFIRFIHHRDIAPCSWVRINDGTYDPLDDDVSRCSYNVTAKHSDVIAVDKNKIAPLLIASFDIECSSSHGDFPVAKKDYRKLAFDLVQTAREREIEPNETASWIWAAFKNREPTDTGVGTQIHEVYPKKYKVWMKDERRTALKQTIVKLAADAAELANQAIRERDREDELTVALAALLTKHLPPLEGDKVIQIGTTVHRYGSDEIIYRHIATLNTCDDIAGAEVQPFQAEAQLLTEWKELLQRLDPDIITGYNIFGFDMSYVWQRAEELGIAEDFGIGLGRLTARRTTLMDQKLSSSALGDNLMYYIDLEGVVCIDMLKVMQRDHKLDSYKLDDVAFTFLGDRKDDITPRDIFEKFYGDSADRAEIAHYCLQDCALINRLMHKLKVLENNVGMGNVCSVPLSYLFMRGQGVKIFSLVAKECRKNGFLIPDLRALTQLAEDAGEVEEEVGYEGAIVLPPKEGMYLNDPITVFDYASLYPSSMIERNLSHDCILHDEAYANAPGVTWKEITYDIYEGVGDKKKKVDEKKCKFAQFDDKRKGVIPNILMQLLTQRKNTRKKIEYERLTLDDGRVAIGLVTAHPETPDTHLRVINVDTLHKADIPTNTVVSREEAFNNFEKAVLDALQLAYKVTANSLYGQIGSRTSPIYWKDIAACTTATGRERIMCAKKFMEDNYQADVIYGDSVSADTPVLLRSRLDGSLTIKTIETLSEEWQPYEQFKPGDLSRRDKQQANVPYEVWTRGHWSPIVRLIRHRVNKQMYRVTTFQGSIDVTEDHSLIGADGEKIKPGACVIGETDIAHSFPDLFVASSTTSLSKEEAVAFGIAFKANGGVLGVPSAILNGSRELKTWFLEGATGAVPTGKLGAMGLYAILRAVGHKNISVGDDYQLTVCDAPLSDKVTRIMPLESRDQFVYDIETEEGIFGGCGVGSIVLKNTDSIFCKFPHGDLKGKDALANAIRIGQTAAKAIKPHLPQPQSLEYEKTLYPFILFSKKRYVGNLYEDDAYKKPKQKSMGIVLKRRDNAPIVKTIYGGCLDIILNKQDLKGSIEFLQTQLQNMVAGNVPLEQLVITKTLKAEYKNPKMIAHKVLADRMGARDPGNKPQANDRIPYAFIVPPPGTTLQGERIEHPAYIRANNLKPDYRFYITNQIMKPVLQLYALCVEELPQYHLDPSYWNQVEYELREKPMYADSETRVKNRMGDLRERMVQELLFDPYIEQLPDCSGKPAAKKRTPKLTAAEPAFMAIGQINRAAAPLLTIEVIEHKEPKSFTCSASLVSASAELYASTETVAKKSKMSRISQIRITAEKVLRAIYENQALRPQILPCGIRIRSSYTMFVNQWKKAIENSAEYQRMQQEAVQNQDIGALREVTDMNIYGNLIDIGALLPYSIEAYKKPAEEVGEEAEDG